MDTVIYTLMGLSVRRIYMVREKSVKVRLTEQEDLFLNKSSERLGINRSEFVRRLIQREMEKKELNIDK